MLNKGLFLACALVLLSACDSSTSDKPAPAPAQPAAPQTAAADTAKPKPAVDLPALSKRYAGRELTVVDASEIQLDGASTLSLSFSVPLNPDQKFAEKVHLVDSVNGKVDGAWELSDNLMELRLRHLEPKRKLVLTIDPGLVAVNNNTLATEFSARLETSDLQATVGFASRGSLLPTRLAEGLPVIALNVDKVDVEFFRIKPDSLPAFLSAWEGSSSLQSYESQELLPMADLVYGGRFDLNPARNTRETVLLPIAGLKQLQQPGVYLAVMRASGTYHYSQPATLFTLSDIGLSAHRYANRVDVFTQALEGGKALGSVDLELYDDKGRVVGQGKTDNAGHAELPLPAKAQVLLAHQGEQTSLLRLNTAALDLAEFDEADLRTAEAGKAASVVAAIPEVRQALFELQRAFATQPIGALLDGRDIGTVIAPEADAKLWVDARVEVRGERRWKELQGQGSDLSLDEVIEQLRVRDQRDQSRKDAPAEMAADAVLIDTSDLTIEAAVEKAIAAVEAAIARGNRT